jgi:glycosyltransferase involved in cell wall biosynthesis
MSADGNSSPRVSLCMIVKNEEHNLADCLRCVKDLVDEMVIVDTGSTDRTKEIAAAEGARVFDYPWSDSFASARNESLRHAQGKWNFWVDADDRIDEENRGKLRQLFASLKDGELTAYLMHCLIVPGSPSDQPRVVDHGRLFPNHPQVRWHYRVHEQILPSVHRLGGKTLRTDITVRHVGYQDASQRPAKLERNLRLLKLEDADHPNDPFTLYNLGRIHERLGKIAEALPYWRRSLAVTPPQETYVGKLYSLMAQGHRQLGQRYKMMTMCLAGLVRFPDQPDLLFLAGSLLHEAGDYLAAEKYFLQLLAAPKDKYFALGDDVGLATYKAKHQLARLYRDMKRTREAETLWREVMAEDQNFAQGWLGLGQALMDLQRWDEVQKIAERLENSSNGKIEGAVLRGLLLATRKDFGEARKMMEEACRQFPEAVEPRVLLSRLLLRDPRDAQAAARVLGELLKLDPSNGEARRHLEKLRHSQAANKPAPAR